MSYDALDWWHTHARRYVDLRTEPELWVLADVLARHTDRDPREGAWPSQARLAEVLGVKAETVGRYIARLEAKGVIKVVPRGGPQVSGKPGRRPHLYLFPEFIAAHGLPPTSPHGIGGNSGEAPSGVTSDDPATDRRQIGGVTSDPRGGYLRSQGGVTSDGPAHDGGGRGTTTEGKEGGAANATPPPACLNHCKQHRDTPCDEVPKCGACRQRRDTNGGRSCRDLADDDRDLTPAEVREILGEDYTSPPPPPTHLLDDPAAYLEWTKEWGRKRKAERLEQAKAARRRRSTGSVLPEWMAPR